MIVISARGDEDDKIRALDMGADDYLTKPTIGREGYRFGPIRGH